MKIVGHLHLNRPLDRLFPPIPPATLTSTFAPMPRPPLRLISGARIPPSHSLQPTMLCPPLHQRIDFFPFCFHLLTNPSTRNSFLFTSLPNPRGVTLQRRPAKDHSPLSSTLCFHIVTNCFSPKPFIFTTIRIARGVSPLRFTLTIKTTPIAQRLVPRRYARILLQAGRLCLS